MSSTYFEIVSRGGGIPRGFDAGNVGESWMMESERRLSYGSPYTAPRSSMHSHSPETPSLDQVFPSKLSINDFTTPLEALFPDYSPQSFDEPSLGFFNAPQSKRGSTSLSEGYDLPSPSTYNQSALWPASIPHTTTTYLPTPPTPEDAAHASSDEEAPSKKSSRKGKTSKSKKSRTQLRTASRAPKKRSASTAVRPAETVEEVRARAAHNQVEQQYRKRLNAHFEKLLDALPAVEGSAAATTSGARDGVGERRVSKAEVLDLAMQRIQSLEKQNGVLEKERRELRGRMHRFDAGLGR